MYIMLLLFCYYYYFDWKVFIFTFTEIYFDGEKEEEEEEWSMNGPNTGSCREIFWILLYVTHSFYRHSRWAEAVLTRRCHRVVFSDEKTFCKRSKSLFPLTLTRQTYKSLYIYLYFKEKWFFFHLFLHSKVWVTLFSLLINALNSFHLFNQFIE